MMQDEQLIKKRFLDLFQQAQRKGIVCFSDFLTLNEQNILNSCAGSLGITYELSGGCFYAERQIAAFLPDALYYEWSYPIKCIEIAPAYPKFADTISHRDVLGALMNLGIAREKLGDILLKDNKAYLFVKREIADYIAEELQQVCHTIVHCVLEEPSAMAVEPELKEFEKIVASNRLDSVIAAMSGKSRSQSVVLIQSGKIFINGAECLHNTYLCKQNDVISIRGTGKFIFDGEIGTTKKSKMKIRFRQYI